MDSSAQVPQNNQTNTQGFFGSVLQPSTDTQFSNIGSDNSPPTEAIPSANTVVTPTPPSSGPRLSKKVIATIFGVLLMVGAITTGVFLSREQQLLPVSAWDCSKYNFLVAQDGKVTVQNASTRSEPAQKAEVFINSTLVKTLDVPNLSPGSSATLGTVTVPSGAFSWRVKGSADCEDSGNYSTPTTSITATCLGVVAYDTNWNVIASSDLSKLKTGDKVRFAVSGNTTGGSFDKARFTVNGTLRSEVTAKKPGTEEYYDEYTIPTGVSNFSIKGEIHHSQLGWF